MAGYYRSSYRYRRPIRRYRKYFRRKFRSYARKYVNGSSRSTVRMKTAINSTTTVTAGHGNDAIGAVMQVFEPYAGSGASSFAACNSPLYRTYCNLYEEVKMIGAKINLAVTSAIGGGDIPSLQIYTAWDRKRGNGEEAVTVASIKASSTHAVATALNNNVAKLSRSCYASDLMEKATWIDSTLDATNGNRNKAWISAGVNPNMFCPSFQFFMNCPSKGETTSVSVSINVTYYFAFRNPRFGGTGDSRIAVSDVGAKRVLPADDDDGDIDGSGGADMDDDAAEVPATIEIDDAAPLLRTQASLGVQPKKVARVVRAGKN